MKLKNIGFVLACLTGFSSKAQQPLTIEQAIGTSLTNNYDIWLSRNDSTLAALDYAFANYAFLPRLNAVGGINFNNNNQKQVLADGTERKSDRSEERRVGKECR